MTFASSSPTGPVRVARSAGNILRFWWWKVPEPRIISIITGIIYSVYLVVGVITLIYPPMSIESLFSSATMQLVGWFFIGGALIGMLGGMKDFWELERVGLGALIVGLAAYLYIVVELQLASDSGHRFTQMGVILIAMLSLAGRGALIWRYDYKPRG